MGILVKNKLKRRAPNEPIYEHRKKSLGKFPKCWDETLCYFKYNNYNIPPDLRLFPKKQ